MEITSRLASIVRITSESIEWHLTKAIFICLRKIAEVPETPVKSYICDTGRMTIGLTQLVTDAMQSQPIEEC